MKKILATFLSLAMLLSACMALPVFAEDATEETETANPIISATEETYIDLENYADGSTIKIKQWASAHGGAYASNTGDTAPDTAKVFVWDTLDNITPLQGAKVITVK